jgi:hypothetical protein
MINFSSLTAAGFSSSFANKKMVIWIRDNRALEFFLKLMYSCHYGGATRFPGINR